MRYNNMKKAKFNIVDIIVILVLVAGIAFVGVKMFGGQEPAAISDPATGNTYQVTFYAECVPEDVAAALVEGSASENASRNMNLGTLVAFSTDASVVYGYDSNGLCVRSEKPGYVSVTLTCELTGQQEPTGLLVGQYMLNIGHNMGVRCGNVEIECIVQNIAAAR